MHPADEIRGSKTNLLSNKRIILALTGSIAAVETIKLSRELIRHGAEVIPVMTPSARKIIHPDSLWFATGNKPIIELTGETEHVSFCGLVKNPVDLLLICPCTANTLSKISHGIDDTTVTTFATTAIGSGVPIMIVPAMHLSMYKHKIIKENISKSKKLGIIFIDPVVEKNKAKLENPNIIISNIIRILGKKDFSNKKILVIGGATTEPIDDVRVISNKSSGKTAIELVKNSFFRAADVELWYGSGKEKPPKYIKTQNFESLDDLFKLLKSQKIKKFDYIFLCAAISDYSPKKKIGKIKSIEENLIINLKKTPKLVSYLRKYAKNSKIIGFKLEEDSKKVKENSYKLLKENNLDFVIGNKLSAIGKDDNEIWITGSNKRVIHKSGKKEELTNIILDKVK